MTTALFVALIVFLATFTQTTAGFAFGMIAMPLLTRVIGFEVTAPLVALVAMTCRVVIMLRYRTHFSVGAMWRVLLASMLFVPVGVFIADRLDEDVVRVALGVIVLGYALYGLFGPALPALRNPLYGIGAGMLGGILGGAYNMAGPPVIMYGSARRWDMEQFKSNLQGYFLANAVVIIAAHVLAQNYTGEVMRNYLVALPAIALGLVAGFTLDRFIEPQQFRRLVLVLLVVLGLQLAI